MMISRVFALAVGTAASCAAFLIMPEADAELVVVLDQSVNAFPSLPSSASSVDDGTTWAQTFTVGAAGLLSKIDLQVAQASLGPPTQTLSLTSLRHREPSRR